MGKERDDETGLYYYGARYYAAWIARFVSVDPLQHEYPHYTPYQYAGNKPITYIDLDGLEEAKITESLPFGKELVGPASNQTVKEYRSSDGIKRMDENEAGEIETSIPVVKFTGGLTIGGDTKQAYDDILSALPSSSSINYRSKVSVNKNKIEFNITKEEADNSNDPGVQALYELTHTNINYYYGVDRTNTIIKYYQDKSTGAYTEPPKTVTEDLTLNSTSGVSGSCKSGEWEIIPRHFKRIGGKVIKTEWEEIQGGKMTRKGFDHERVIAPAGRIFNTGNGVLSRPAVVLHELNEMRYMGRGWKRGKAHNQSIIDSRKLPHKRKNKDIRYDNVQTN